MFIFNTGDLVIVTQDPAKPSYCIVISANTLSTNICGGYLIHVLWNSGRIGICFSNDTKAL